MMYPFMTLNDETEIVHSDMNEDGTFSFISEEGITGEVTFDYVAPQ